MAAKHTFDHRPRYTQGGERALASPLPERAWQDDRARFVPEHAPDGVGRQLQFLSEFFDGEQVFWERFHLCVGYLLPPQKRG